MSETVHLAGPRAAAGASRSWWLQEALAIDSGVECPELVGAIHADIAVIGGGYTGMWAALRAKEIDPGATVVLLEADICGSGPSGRNGGFCYGLWEDLATLTQLFGREDALRIGFAADAAIASGIATLTDAGHDVWHTPSGYITVSTSAHYDTELHALVHQRQSYPGLPRDYFTLLDAKGVAARVRSPRFRGGLFTRVAATVQPARVARRLRQLLLDVGVQVYETTPVREFTCTAPVQITTMRGSVQAEQVVIGINAWSDQ
ncbi:MAG: NAD(P)/FAD-dependent oxidoreductase, partial [Acidimicrobiia bacterium]